MGNIVEKLRALPYVLLVLATFFWGTNFVFSRMIVEHLPPVQLSVLRWGLASLVFLPFVWKELKEHRAVMMANWKSLIFLGLTGIAGFNTLLYIAIQYTTSINASLVNSTAPLLIVLLSVLFLKEKIIPIQYLGIIVSFIGVMIVVSEGSLQRLLTLSFNPGDLIVVGAVISWSIYSILMRKFGIHLPKKPTFILTMYIGILSLLPFALVERGYELVALTDLPAPVWTGIVYLAIFPSLVSFICWNEGVMQVGPGKASNYLHLIVLFTGILAVLFGGEVFTSTQFIGGVFILSGVILASNPQFLMKWTKKSFEASKAEKA